MMPDRHFTVTGRGPRGVDSAQARTLLYVAGLRAYERESTEIARLRGCVRCIRE
jgi:hypothetical protein